MKPTTFDEIWNDIADTLEQEKEIYTLVKRKVNVITMIDGDGFHVMTERSRPKSEVVPKWMFEKAIKYLIEHKTLTNATLLNDLNVKRSSFVMAALSRLTYIDYKTRPLKIILIK